MHTWYHTAVRCFPLTKMLHISHVEVLCYSSVAVEVAVLGFVCVLVCVFAWISIIKSHGQFFGLR